MKRATLSTSLKNLSLFLILLLVSFSFYGCQDAQAEDTQNHDQEIEEDHTGHDHALEEVHPDEEEEEHNVHDEDLDDHDELDEHDEDLDDHESEEEAGLVLSERNIEDAGIEFSTASSGSVDYRTQLLGEITMNSDQMFHVVPPVSGTVEEIRVQIGDRVEAGDVLAVLSSRDLADASGEYLRAGSSYSLAQTVHGNQQELYEADFLSEQDYLVSRQANTEARIEFQTARQSLLNLGLSENEINRINSGSALTRQELRSPIEGTVVALNLEPGEIVGDETNALTVADLSSVWVDLSVLQTDVGRVRAGQTLTVSASESHIPEASTVLDYISPVIDRSTRTASARAELPNPHGHWMPGLFVTAHVVTAESVYPVVINRDAVQSLEGEHVVFIQHGDSFETVPVELGQSNRTHVEIKHGLEQGDIYVSGGAFALKAEIVTSGLDSHAGHGH